jgi:molybdate transport repressor ModE-like protein
MAPIDAAVERTTLGALWDATRMRLLAELARQDSVSAAARAVGITQSTASEHLRVLETAAGQPLVERNGRGSRLTDAGRVLAARAAEALAALGAGEEEVAGLAGLRTGRVTIAASTAPAGYLLPDTLGCFRDEYPGVAVEVEVAASGEIVRRLLAGRVQLAIVGGAPADERLAAEPFVDDEIVGVARPGVLPVRDGVVPAAALADVTLLAREDGSSTQALADAELRAAGAEPAARWELGSSEAVKRAARAGLGFAFVSRYAVAEEVERGELEHFRLAGREPLRRQFLVVRLAGRQPSPAETAFVETLRRCCASSAAFAAACVARA